MATSVTAGGGDRGPDRRRVEGAGIKDRQWSLPQSLEKYHANRHGLSVVFAQVAGQR